MALLGHLVQHIQLIRLCKWLSGKESACQCRGKRSESKSCSIGVWLFVTPWTIQSMEFSRLNTGVDSLSRLLGIFPAQGSNQVFCIAGGFFTSWVTREAHQCRRHGFSPWVGKIPQRRKRQPTPVYLPGKSHGQRILAGYSPWGCKESDTIKRLTHHRACPAWLWWVLSASSFVLVIISAFSSLGE